MLASSIFITALAAAAMAFPTAQTDDEEWEDGGLPCWTQDFKNTTTATSPLITDCRALSEHNIPQTWVPSSANNYTFSVQSGTCAFKGVFLVKGSNLEARYMTVHPSMVSGAINYAIEHLAGHERVAANGAMACILGGRISELGWVDWNIFTAE